MPELPEQMFYTILNYRHSPWDVGCHVRAISPYPCHMTLYWTYSEPLRHRTSRVFRGIEQPWSAYFCFVAYTGVEQEEAGDSTIHTFWMPDWLEGQTRFWTTRASVNDELTPSSTPIIKYTHPGGTPRLVFIRPNAQGHHNGFNIYRYTPYPNQFWNVNEIEPDFDTTYNSFLLGVSTSYATETYNLDTAIVGQIDSVTFYALMKRLNGYHYHRCGKVSFRTHDQTYHTPEYRLNTVYAWEQVTHTVNPYTLLPWTQEEIDVLEAGASTRCIAYAGGTTYVRVSTVKVLITRAINTPSVEPAPYP